MQHHHKKKMRRLSHSGLDNGNGLADRKESNNPYSNRPLYFTSAAEPLIIETPAERKISRSRLEQMAVIADSGTASTQKSSSLKDSTQPLDWSSSAEHNEDEEPIGILKSLRSYPRGVFFMLGNEFCERFSFYGMRAILIIYLTTDHHLSENIAKQIYHAFVSLAYFSPLFGSILADNYFGRFRVILWVSLIYVLGHVLLSIGAIPFLETSIKRGLDYTGLAVIAIATGGIKPCVSAFAADQFTDEQHRERTQFFSFFYFAINAGSLIAIGITPLLRKVSCFNSDHCFPLAFGVPGVLMLIAFITFLAGWRTYKIRPANKGNILWKVVKCICYALRLKIGVGVGKKRIRHSSPPEHWLDYAVPRYDEHLVSGIKTMLAVIVLYIPVVFFWALFDQQGSTWVLQARRMDGHVGFFTILPDQMNTFNPLMILILVPLFEAWIYPCMNKICKITPLRKMAVGGILAAVAFCIAGVVQVKINSTMEPRPNQGNAFVYRLGNSNNKYCVSNNTEICILAGEGKQEITAGNFTFRNTDESGNKTFDLNMATEPATNYVIGIFNESNLKFPYSIEKTADGKTRFYFLVFDNSPLSGKEAYVIVENGERVANSKIYNGNFIDIQPGIFAKSKYKITYGDCVYESNSNKPICNHQVEVRAQMGAAFVLDLTNPRLTNSPLYELVRSNSVSILWQLPQLFVMTVGEILFSVTGLEFSYSQAAPSMKSVLQALWLLTVFFGNVVDIIISHMEISDPVAEFFIYASLMFAVIGIFIVLAMRYEYVDEHNLEIPESTSQEDDKSEKISNLPQLDIRKSD